MITGALNQVFITQIESSGVLMLVWSRGYCLRRAGPDPLCGAYTLGARPGRARGILGGDPCIRCIFMIMLKTTIPY